MKVHEIQMQPESVRVKTDRLTLRIEERRDEHGVFSEVVYVVASYGQHLADRDQHNVQVQGQTARVTVTGPQSTEETYP